MGKSLNAVLNELDYTVKKSEKPDCRQIYKGSKLVIDARAGEVWNYLRHEHPEYFGEVPE